MEEDVDSAIPKIVDRTRSMDWWAREGDDPLLLCRGHLVTRRVWMPNDGEVFISLSLLQ